MMRYLPLAALLLVPLAGCGNRPADTRIGSLGTGGETIRSTAIGAPGQTTVQQTVDEAGQRKQLEKQLSDVQGDLQVLKDRAKNASADVKAKLQPTIDALEKQAATTREQLSALSSQGAEAWRAAQPGLRQALNGMRDAIKRAGDQFRK